MVSYSAILLVKRWSEVEFAQSEEFYMKKSRFTDSQIIDAQKWDQAGFKVPA